MQKAVIQYQVYLTVILCYTGSNYLFYENAQMKYNTESTKTNKKK